MDPVELGQEARPLHCLRAGDRAPVRLPSSRNHIEVSLPTRSQDSPVNLSINTIKTFITLHFIYVKDYL